MLQLNAWDPYMMPGSHCNLHAMHCSWQSLTDNVSSFRQILRQIAIKQCLYYVAHTPTNQIQLQIFISGLDILDVKVMEAPPKHASN